MAGRFPALAALIALALAACVEVTPRGPQTPEAELARQARALQRTVLEGAAYGAVAGAGGAYVFGGRGNVPGGIFVGVPMGVATGTYVGSLQQRYATREARLDRLTADLAATNAETEATIRTMREVLAHERRELAAGGSAEAAEASLSDMALATDGAEGRLAEFGATRALGLVGSGDPGVDPQVAELSARIAEMRTIAATLAEAL